MTIEEETLIHDSWERVQPHADELVTRFYDRLFQLNPGARALFTRSDHAALRRKFLDMLGEIVELTRDPDRLIRVLVQLGRRHAEYGVEARDYDDANTALVWALHETLREQFTEEAADAWRELVHTLSGVMQRAGRASIGRASGP